MDKKSKALKEEDLIVQLEQKSALVKSASDKIKSSIEFVERDYLIAHNYLTDIINFLQAKFRSANGLIQSYIDQREDLTKLMYIAELKAKANNKIPTQINKDMPFQMIHNCILNAETLKKNDTRVVVNEENSTSHSTAKSISALDLGIDCEKIISLYNELLESDEFTDILYSNIFDLTEQLKETDKRLSDEIERLL